MAENTNDTNNSNTSNVSENSNVSETSTPSSDVNPYGDVAAESGNVGSFGENLWNAISNGTGTVGGVLDYGLTTGAEMWLGSMVASKLTKHPTLGKLIGIGGVLALQNMEMIPTSLEPVKDWVMELGDPEYKKKKEEAALQESESDTNSSTVDEAESNARLVEVNEDFNAGVSTVYNNIGSAGVEDIDTSMHANGLAVANNNGFMAVAAVSDRSLSGLGVVASDNMALFEERVASLRDDTGLLSDAAKSYIVAELKELGSGFASYGKGAMEGISSQYVEGSDEYIVSVYGLDKVMQQETLPYYDLLNRLDEEYELFSDEDRAYFDSLNIEGVPTYSEYNNGVSMDSATIPLPEADTSAEETTETTETAETDASALAENPSNVVTATNVSYTSDVSTDLPVHADAHEVSDEDLGIIDYGVDNVNIQIGCIATDISNGQPTDGMQFESDMYYAGQSAVINDVFTYAASYNTEALHNSYEEFCGKPIGELSDKIRGLCDENGQLSDENKKFVADELRTLAAGYQSYSKGAMDAISNSFTNDDDKQSRQNVLKDGLGKLMREQMSPFYGMMYELNSEYGLFSEEDIKALDSMKFEGVPSFSEYSSLEDAFKQPDSSAKNASVSQDESAAKREARVAMAQDVQDRNVKEESSHDFGVDLVRC